MKRNWIVAAPVVAVAILLAFHLVSPGVAAPVKLIPARVIEYKLVSCTQLPPEALWTELNSLGKEGWDLVTIDSDAGSKYLILKR
jgi:hypothetical protein